MNNSHLELSRFLSTRVPDFEIDNMALLMGGFSGKIADQPVCISLSKGQHLVISIAGSVNNLDIFRNHLVEFMDGFEPICLYDLILKDSKISMPTLEWDNIDPEGRIKDLVNGKAHTGSSVENLILFNRDLTDYTSEEAKKLFDEREAERIKNARIFGIDTGLIDPKTIEPMDIIDLWLTLDAIGGLSWRLRHDAYHGRIPVTDTTEYQYAIEYLVYIICQKLDIQVSEPIVDKHITVGEDYGKWYKFYNNHFKYVLSDKEWEEFIKLREAKGDFSKFLPKGDWRVS